MHGRNSRPLFCVIIENNEVGIRVEDHAGVVPAWTSPAGMWKRISRRVSGLLDPANDHKWGVRGSSIRIWTHHFAKI
jgi:hypothetical protein